MYRLTLLLVFACALGAISAYPGNGEYRVKRGEYGGNSGHSSYVSQKHHHGYQQHARMGRAVDAGLDDSDKSDKNSQEDENGDEQVDITQLDQSQVKFDQKVEQEKVNDITEDAKLLFSDKDSSSETRQVISEVTQDQRGQSEASVGSKVKSELAVNQSRNVDLIDIRNMADQVAVDNSGQVAVNFEAQSEFSINQTGNYDLTNTQKATLHTDFNKQNQSRVNVDKNLDPELPISKSRRTDFSSSHRQTAQVAFAATGQTEVSIGQKSQSISQTRDLGSINSHKTTLFNGFDQKGPFETIIDKKVDSELAVSQSKNTYSVNHTQPSQITVKQPGKSQVNASQEVSEYEFSISQTGSSNSQKAKSQIAPHRNCHSKVNVGNKVKSEHDKSQVGSSDFSNRQKGTSEIDTVNKGRFEFTNGNKNISQITSHEKSQSEPIVGHSVDAGNIGEHKNHYEYSHKETPKIAVDYNEHTKGESEHQKPFRLDEDNDHHHAHDYHLQHHHNNKETPKIAHDYKGHSKIDHGYKESFHSTADHKQQFESSSGQTETPQISVDTKEQIETEGASKAEPEIAVVQTGQVEIASSTQETPVVSIAPEEQAEFDFSRKEESKHDISQKPLKDYDYHNHHPHYHHHHQNYDYHNHHPHYHQHQKDYDYHNHHPHYHHQHHYFPRDHGHQGHWDHDGPSVVYGL